VFRERSGGEPADETCYPNLMRRAATAAVLLLAALAARPWAVNGPSRLRLVSPYRVAPAAGELRLGLEFRTDPGWHVYWKNSGDAGYPPAVRWSGRGIASPELRWPAPRRFDLPGGLVTYGYEGEVIYPVAARLSTGGPPSFRLAADVDYLVCQVDCIPFRSRLTLEQPVGAAAVPDPEIAAAVDSWWRRLPTAVGAAPGVAADLRYDPTGPALALAIHGASAGPGTDLFLEPQDLFDAGRPQARPLPDGVAFRVPVARRQVNRPLPPSAPFAWTATGLRGPRGPLDLAGRSALALAPLPGGAARQKSGTRPGAPVARDFAGALLGGLLLALAPAPLALFLAWLTGPAGTAASEGRGRRTGVGARIAGIVAAAWAVAAVARAGAFAGWGTALGRPAWTAGLAALAALVALDLWGLIEPPAEAGPDVEAARGVLAGAAAPLLALAWPLPAAARVDLAGRGGAAAWLLATAVAAGLALPYAAGAAALRRRPRHSRLGAGPLREALGFLAGAAVLWLLYRLAGEVLPEGLALVELLLLAAALLAWLRARAAQRNRLRWALGAALLACALAAPFAAAGGSIALR